MKKSTLFHIVLVAIFFTSTLYLLYLNYLKPQSTSTPTTGIIPTETSDPTANWKTYVNNRYSYQLKYPENITPIEEDGQFNSVLIPNQKIQQVTFSDNTFSFKIYFEGEFDHGFEPWKLDKRESVVFGDKTATKTILSIPNSENLWIIYTIDNFHSFRIEVTTDKTQLNTIDQILSTFKFTGSNVSFDSPQSVVKKYLDASIKGDLATAKIYCPDIKSTALDSYHFIDYQILSSKADKDPNYYHVYVQFTDETGEIYNNAPHGENPLEVLLYKKPDGQWKALTWYFYQ